MISAFGISLVLHHKHKGIREEINIVLRVNWSNAWNKHTLITLASFEN
jgi:hypothetical protein